MRQPQRLKAVKPPENGVLIDFDENPMLRELIDTIKETNGHLASIAGVGDRTLGFFRKWVPWIIAAAGVLYPAFGKLINGLPNLPV